MQRVGNHTPCELLARWYWEYEWRVKDFRKPTIQSLEPTARSRSRCQTDRERHLRGLLVEEGWSKDTYWAIRNRLIERSSGSGRRRSPASKARGVLRHRHQRGERGADALHLRRGHQIAQY